MLNEHLEHRINQNLLASTELSSQPIAVRADNGKVTLTGTVQSFRRKLAAQQSAASDNHVVEVINELVVCSPVVDDDGTIAATINRLLDRAAGLTNESIFVVSRNQLVSLTGYVNSEHEKLRAADIANSVMGVIELQNLLIANPDQVIANLKHCEAIVNSVATIIGLENEAIRLSVVNESARISGSVDSFWKKAKIESVVREFGILTVSNEIVVQE